MMSESRRSGSAARNDSSSPALARASSRPAGLRSQTPISQTASTPDGVTESQAASLTVPRVAGADPGAVVAVVVLVEQHQIAPVRVGLQHLLAAVDRPVPGRVAAEGADQ